MLSMWKTVNRLKIWLANMAVYGEVPSYLRGGFNCLRYTCLLHYREGHNFWWKKLSRELKHIT
jgi:hypothetical protein